MQDIGELSNPCCLHPGGVTGRSIREYCFTFLGVAARRYWIMRSMSLPTRRDRPRSLSWRQSGRGLWQTVQRSSTSAFAVQFEWRLHWLAPQVIESAPPLCVAQLRAVSRPCGPLFLPTRARIGSARFLSVNPVAGVAEVQRSLINNSGSLRCIKGGSGCPTRARRAGFVSRPPAPSTSPQATRR